MRDTPGTVYLLHLTPAYKHARHYIGWTGLPLEERLAKHRTCDGAKLLQAQLRSGGDFVLARVWAGGTPALERQLKDRGGAARICPICRTHAGKAAELRHDYVAPPGAEEIAFV